MFSSNFDNAEPKGTSYDNSVCMPKLYPYATGNSGPSSAVWQSLPNSNLASVSWLSCNKLVIPVNHTNASLSHFANLKVLGAAAPIALFKSTTTMEH